MRIVHVITGLEPHGAELMLQRLILGLPESYHASVVSLTSLGSVGTTLRSRGVEVLALDMPPGKVTPRAVARLARALRQAAPDVVHTWLYHADLVGGAVARMSTSHAKVVWSVRQTALHPSLSRWSTRLTERACAVLAPLIPHHVVFNSEAAADAHLAKGYRGDRATVIPNGFDLDEFHADADAGRVVRTELALPTEARLVGCFGRFDPQKDQRRFLAAFALVAKAIPAAFALLVGDGADDGNPVLSRWVAAAELEGRVLLLGRRNDMARLTAALDVAVSSSLPGEGFPNVIGEAMACEVPCVVTPSGDARAIVGETGVVVEEPGAEPLAAAIVRLLGDEDARSRLGAAARARMQRDYSLPAIVDRYVRFYDGVVAPAGSSG